MPSYSRRVRIPGKTSQELYDILSQEIDRFLTKTIIGHYDLQRDPIQKELRIKSSLFSATLICTEAQLELNAQLSLMALPFRSKLDESITRWLTKTFNGSFA